MKGIKETIGNTTIIIQTIDEEVDIIGEASERKTNLTGLDNKLEGAYQQLKIAIKQIAMDLGAELNSIDSLARPQQVGIEFQVGVSAQVGPVMIVGGKGEYAIKVKIQWLLGKNEEK